MRIFNSVALIAFAMIHVGGTAPSYAANAQVVARPTAVMVTDNSNFGGCMVSLETDPQSLLADCAKGWISFSCSGDFTDPVRAYRMLDQAQLALATRLRLRIQFSDERKHNNYCVAYRVDVIR